MHAEFLGGDGVAHVLELALEQVAHGAAVRPGGDEPQGDVLVLTAAVAVASIGGLTGVGAAGSEPQQGRAERGDAKGTD